MARIKRKGEAGAAKAYVTRTSAIKKLQCSLADFRRLCILKGIFPREPRSKKKANKGSSAPTSFYYAKDIAYLAHEPVLRKLRDQKAFAKRFAKALGRSEWSVAKSLEDKKPVYRIDHIIKERYPSFVDALRDIDDALCMIFLFASLPSGPRLAPGIVESCSKLAAQWQLYIIKASALRKVFLSIKGVYYQAEIMGQSVTWLVPYIFPQSIPIEIDVRVMLTFLELYQTLLGFVFFKLYTDVGLLYPPAIDITREEGAAGLAAFVLQNVNDTSFLGEEKTGSNATQTPSVTVKDVRVAIKSITAGNAEPLDAMPNRTNDKDGSEQRNDADEFTVQPTSSNLHQPIADLTTLRTIESQSDAHFSQHSSLFAPYSFFLSRETPRSLFEFVVRSFGGRIGWHDSQGAHSPISENDESITHIIIDRPPVVGGLSELTDEQRLIRTRRKHVQPQWIMDCVNAGKILPEDDYAQGKLLPPHLSPFGEQEGAHTLASTLQEETQPGQTRHQEDDESIEGESEVDSNLEDIIADPGLLRTAELQAEARGLDAKQFEKAVTKANRKRGSEATRDQKTNGSEEKHMNKMLMSNKQRKLYEKLKFTQDKKANERERLEQRRKAINQVAKRSKA